MAQSTRGLLLNNVLFGLLNVFGELRQRVNFFLGTDGGTDGGGTGGGGTGGSGQGGTGGGQGGTGGTGTSTGGRIKGTFPLNRSIFSTNEFFGVCEFDGCGLA